MEPRACQWLRLLPAGAALAETARETARHDRQTRKETERPRERERQRQRQTRRQTRRGRKTRGTLPVSCGQRIPGEGLRRRLGCSCLRQPGSRVRAGVTRSRRGSTQCTS
eukprot:1828566-Rhodomonas_salina.1